MPNSKYPLWLDEFMSAFGGQNEILNQKDFVQQQNQQQNRENMNSMNELMKNNTEDSAIENGVNDQTGNKYEIVVQRDRDEKARKDRGLQVQFSSGENKELYICSSINDFCNGKYSNLKNESLDKIAKIIAKDNQFVISFLENSIAANTEQMEIEQAIKIANSITKNDSILESDYDKICSKLDEDNIKIFSNYLGTCGISVVSNRNSIKQDVSYFIDFIKDFKEYKTAKDNLNIENINRLKYRIASIKTFEKVKSELNQEFQKDNILKFVAME